MDILYWKFLDFVDKVHILAKMKAFLTWSSDKLKFWVHWYIPTGVLILFFIRMLYRSLLTESFKNKPVFNVVWG